jgi:hypothetical protein
MSRIFGAIRQNGMVVRDIEGAMRHWSGTLGVGPFFYLPRLVVQGFLYRGAPSAIEVSIALANSGALQIELIEQHNDAPSMYRDFLAAGHEGLHHVGVFTETLDAHLERARAAGCAVAQSGSAGPGNRFAYLEPEAHPGSIVELIETGGTTGALFKGIEEAARTWDGSDPIRRLEVGGG